MPQASRGRGKEVNAPAPVLGAVVTQPLNISEQTLKRIHHIIENPCSLARVSGVSDS